MASTTPANHDPALCHPAPATPASQPPQTLPQNITPTDIPAQQLDQHQIMTLLRSLPGVFTKLKEDAASTGLPGINDPGPSSHPRGPPNLGQLSAVAMQAESVNVQPPPPQPPQPPPQPRPEDVAPDQSQTASTSRRGGRSATMGTDEWSRQRKDNHVGIPIIISFLEMCD